ncbi:MAG: long-chain fatty acid--CoA ligase [Sandaracinaceae bacterium]|nr:long-chain fatty acid--CoA ligase [Sandaracinaceae bacterium]
MPQEPKFRNLVQLYQHAVKRYPMRPLFGTKVSGTWRWMTYSEFGAQVDQFRAGLVALGIQKGDRVAVICDNRPEWAIGAYAAYGIGASYVAMYEAQADKEWLYILSDCGAQAVMVANEKIRDRIVALKAQLPALSQVIVLTGRGDADSIAFPDVLAKGRENPVPAIEPAGEDISAFIYTSGTTGNPKGVLLSHTNIASNVSAMHELFPMAQEDRSLSFLPWAHSFGQTVELHGLLSMGASMGIAEAVEKIIDNLAEVRPTLLFSVPRIFNKIYDSLHKRMANEGGITKKLFDIALANETKRKELAQHGKSSALAELMHTFFDRIVFAKIRARFGGRLKYAFSGGAAISKEVAEFVDNLGILVYEGYGLTETSPIATANWPGTRKIGSVGKALPGVRVVIDKEATGEAKNGEIIVYGPNIMLGYHGLPEEDEKVFTSDRGFRTGDTGYLDDEGFLYITGRIKELYKLENGKYVSPAPLEEHLKLSSFIANVMVYGDNKPFNVALVVADVDSVKRWAADQGISASDNTTLLENERVRKLFDDELDKFSAEFKHFEKIRKFTLVAEDFTTQNDMLTPSLKVKRRVVMNRYGKALASLYT